ncbi:hypothetical protein LOK49_LG08G02720 [Camellia lanceoleosa]|uniref:Uncharacterized protein n=1 Tax=Camellia lanceoleosa TaxID=1840588 RepID=A0ACC0GV25_9ERIC|nr:hypothetical protein LOK49_LG08G02720 [Camellia lanceoleosa]
MEISIGEEGNTIEGDLVCGGGDLRGDHAHLVFPDEGVTVDKVRTMTLLCLVSSFSVKLSPIDQDISNTIIQYLDDLGSVFGHGIFARGIIGVVDKTCSLLVLVSISLMVYPYRNWPTFPQIFIKGEFIGGSDIILNMHQTGELKEMLKDIATN